MRVQINESGRDNQPARVENFAPWRRADFSRWSDFGNALAVEKYIFLGVRLAGWIEDASVLNQQHAWIPWVAPLSPDEGRRPPRRQ